MNENLQKGIITEQKCILKCLEENILISKPIIDARYDLILDIKGKMFRIQIKTSRWTSETKEAFTFNCKSTHSVANGNKIMPYTKDEIDFFMTEKDDVFYLIPAGENSSQKTLRMVPPRNGQKTGFSLAEDYLFEEVIKKLFE